MKIEDTLYFQGKKLWVAEMRLKNEIIKIIKPPLMKLADFLVRKLQ